MRVLIFSNDHKVKPKRVRASRLTFTMGNRSYTIDPQEIYQTKYKDKPYRKSKPMAIYFENNPQPVGYVTDGSFKDKSGSYLEKAIAINAIKQQSGQGLGKNILPLIETLGSYITIGNVFMLIVALSLIYAFITGEFM